MEVLARMDSIMHRLSDHQHDSMKPLPLTSKSLTLRKTAFGGVRWMSDASLSTMCGGQSSLFKLLKSNHEHLSTEDTPSTVTDQLPQILRGEV